MGEPLKNLYTKTLLGLIALAVAVGLLLFVPAGTMGTPEGFVRFGGNPEITRFWRSIPRAPLSVRNRRQANGTSTSHKSSVKTVWSIAL